VKLSTFFIGKWANKEAIYVIFLIIFIAVLNPPRDSEQQRLEDGIGTFVLVYRMRARNFGGSGLWAWMAHTTRSLTTYLLLLLISMRVIFQCLPCV